MFPSVYTIFSPLEYSYKLYSFLHTLEYLVEIVEYELIIPSLFIKNVSSLEELVPSINNVLFIFIPSLLI